MANKRMKLATREKRFLAGLIDDIIPGVIIAIMVLFAPGLSGLIKYLFLDLDDDYTYNYFYNMNSGSYYAGIGITIFLVIFIIVYTIVEIFFFSKGQSIGKAIFGLKVVASKNGKPLGIWWMLLREFIVKQASSEVFCLGYIWILIDDKNRGWHDKILDTYVIDIKETDRLNDKKVDEQIVTPVVKTEEMPSKVQENNVQEPIITPASVPMEKLPEPTEEQATGVAANEEAEQAEEVTAEFVEMVSTEESDVNDANDPVQVQEPVQIEDKVDDELEK